MAMSKTIQQKMHEQHRKWQRDHTTWLENLDAWKKELRVALSDLFEVEDMLRDYLDVLDVHADAIWQSRQRIQAHELVLSTEIKAGANETDRALAVTHHRVAAQHERATNAHARIRKHHHKVIVEVMRILRQARAAM
jgi:hypothetical protein